MAPIAHIAPTPAPVPVPAHVPCPHMYEGLSTLGDALMTHIYKLGTLTFHAAVKTTLAQTASERMLEVDESVDLLEHYSNFQHGDIPEPTIADNGVVEAAEDILEAVDGLAPKGLIPTNEQQESAEKLVERLLETEDYSVEQFYLLRSLLVKE
jgi:hypothetical protein